MGQRIFSCVAKKKDQIKFKIIVIIIIIIIIIINIIWYKGVNQGWKIHLRRVSDKMGHFPFKI